MTDLSRELTETNDRDASCRATTEANYTALADQAHTASIQVRLLRRKAMDPNFTRLIAQMQADAERQALFALAVLLLIAIAVFVATYYAMRAAIRDGIRDSGLIEAARQRATAPPTERRTDDALIPDMRADR
jgi:hypothetical protein